MKKSKQHKSKGALADMCNKFGGLSSDAYVSLTDRVSQSFNGGDCRQGNELTFVRQPVGSSQIKYIDFVCNGRYISCIEIQSRINQQGGPPALNSLLPTCQLLLLQFVHKAFEEVPLQRNDVLGSPEDANDFEIAASIGLDFLDVYGVALSNNTAQISVYGFSYKEIPRKPCISVYEFITVNGSITIRFMSKLTFQSCEILLAKVTSSTYLPRNDNILLTSICTDYHSVRKTNCLDFWNTRSGLSLATLYLQKECPKFKGFVSSAAFSPDGLILALISSTKNWQLLPFSIVANKFGQLFSLEDHGYHDPVEHFTTFCEFKSGFGKYELMVFSDCGTLTLLSIDAENINAKQLIYSIDLQQTIGSNITAFKYCPAFYRCYFKTKTKISFIDLETCKINTEFNFDEHEKHSCIAISKTGMDLAFVMNSSTMKMLSCKSHKISLKNLCRCRIIKLIPEDKILEQEIPKVLATYLLYGKY